MRIDIHDYPGRLAKALERVDQSDLTEKNKQVIREFAQYLQVRTISAPRIEKYVGTLRLIGLALGKNFRDATRTDLEGFMFNMRSRQDRSIWTKNDYAVTLHRFYRWLEGGDKRVPSKVSGITTTIRKKDQPRIKKAELITEDEVRTLLRAAENPRDRALIAMTWDTGGRIGEVGGLAISDLTFGNGETQIDLRGKTGARTVLAIECTPHVLNWLQNHPRNEDPKAPLWLGLGQVADQRERALPYRSLYAVFQRAFRRAGIRKKFNPHLFRHSRATWCVEHGWSTYELCQHFGWELDSGMPAVYLSLSDGMVHDKMRSTYGLAKPREKSEPAVVTCARCSSRMPIGHSRCFQCGFQLNDGARYSSSDVLSKQDAALSVILQDRRVAELVRRVLSEKSAGVVSTEGGHPGSALPPLPPVPERVDATPEDAAGPSSSSRVSVAVPSGVLRGKATKVAEREVA